MQTDPPLVHHATFFSCRLPAPAKRRLWIKLNYFESLFMAKLLKLLDDLQAVQGWVFSLHNFGRQGIIEAAEQSV
jgi:hypothetical protein